MTHASSSCLWTGRHTMNYIHSFLLIFRWIYPPKPQLKPFISILTDARKLISQTYCNSQIQGEINYTQFVSICVFRASQFQVMICNKNCFKRRTQSNDTIFYLDVGTFGAVTRFPYKNDNVE